MADSFQQGCIQVEMLDGQVDYLRRAMALLESYVEEHDMAIGRGGPDYDLDAGEDGFRDAVVDRLASIGIHDLLPWDCAGSVGFNADFATDSKGRQQVWLYGDDWFNGEGLAEVLHGMLKASNDDRVIECEYAYYCSKARPDEFGGACFVVSKDGAKFGGTNEMVRRLRAELADE